MNPPFSVHDVETPAYVTDRGLLTRNLEILRDVKNRAGCKILLAQKAFSMFRFYPLIGEYLDGTCSSGLYEAKLGREYMNGEVHVFSAAYRPHEFAEVAETCDYVLFNSIAQWEQYGREALEAGCSCGLRINPECSTQDFAIYDPCSPGSRLGVTVAEMPEKLPEGISGLHFHTLCQQGSDALERTLDAVEAKFGKYLHEIKWLNFGGGHHITREGYDIERLIACVKRMKERYGVEVYLEPGEAVALNAGFLVASVLDITQNGDVTNVILDASAACHMPDVIEMPYRPPVLNSGKAGEKAYTYRFGGATCLAGDIIGDYSFDSPLSIGDRVVFVDMAIYTMVKNNTFNGMELPAIYASDAGAVQLVREFGYEDFKNRLS
ncbi:MAG: carboxynorspermidine decarboxylase [Methanosarcinales archaeon]|jgi:carboxynorspermidine decarboxylase|nr:carboxynorspermidine decarboxylase [Methanosarcinales archaeon]